MTNSKATKKALFTSLLSLLLCFTMLMGATFAWFTDTVTSANNIIKSGNLDVEMYWAEGDEDPASATWTDASKGAIFDYDLWEPGYTEARHLRIANEGDLAFKYGLRFVANGTVSKLADVIDVYYFEDAKKLTRENVEDGTYLGTIMDILGTEKNISDKVAGMLIPDEEKQITLALKMKESAGNEYQNLSIGTDFSVELIAVQATYEEDSFDEFYDKNALSAEVPAALVRELDDKTVSATAGIGGAASEIVLDTAYQFQPTQSYEELMESEYKYYLADFVVSADKDVPANSIALAGYYDAWCQYNDDNWVAMVNNGFEVKAGQEIYLVEALGAAVHYKDICQYGNDGIGFLCGAADLTGENAGTTLTVKLCLFETTADPNGSSASTEKVEGAEPIVIGEFKYTFPETQVATTPWDVIDVVSSDTEVSNKVADDYVEICHKSGDLTISNATFKNGLTIYNEEGTTGTVTLKDCTIYLSNGTAANTGYNMCKADHGMYVGAISENVTWKFENCIFTAANGHIYAETKGWNVYIGSNYNADSFTFDGCTFEKSAKHAIGCSSDADATYYALKVTGCNFKDWNNNATDGAAIRGNLPATDFAANITITGNTFGNSNSSTQSTVAIDSWTGSWS